MGDLLSRMARASAARAAAARSRERESDLQRRALDAAPPPSLSLAESGFDLIAEVKRRSPASGDLAAEGDELAARCRTYAGAGAAIVSILTEPDEFLGSLGDLQEASRAIAVPVMRKDFLVDPYQVLEARACGAAGVLLILKIVDEPRLAEMLDAAARAGLFVLLEAFDEEDLSRSGDAVAVARKLGLTILVGLNARDLRTLAVDPGRLERLRALIPEGVPAVAESGLATPDDVRRVASLGYRLALVGESLMRSPDPSALVTSMLEAGIRGQQPNFVGSRSGAGATPVQVSVPLRNDCRRNSVAVPELVPDERGRYGAFGGRFVPETLMGALGRLEAHARAALVDPSFRVALDRELRDWVGRPTPLTEAARLGKRWGASVWLKREDLAHTGAHKINNAMGQALLAAGSARVA